MTGDAEPGAVDESPGGAADGGPDDSWAEVSPEAARRLLLAAVEAFAERGFHATTTRDIASRAGMSPAALYIHYRTKEELLYQISRVGHERSVRILTEADDSVAGAPGRLAAAVRAFVRWHAERHTTARVVQYELGALAEDHYAEIVALRRRSEEILRGILADGVATGEFTVEDIRGTALAVLSLCVDVARWFRSGGPRTPEEIGELYAGLVLRMVGSPAAPESGTAAGGRG
ncbi:TetR/AcrR family transcriptional regulator [Streptomyces sp. TRM 70361]|uniref:TetR/AcrR family transcriptional regulator n=1 Tax=Streptomyces sp. TRM 70361 TaxID=3116553 RepID=UPI002E7BAFF4|nr:TetR/AcrR family transcriptional regulator [Streptomyces sp. TRM 70361]MEE1942771.1 TetR/AcrR family transcriptional regulator [Streptomyces sp. TRM 70361]